MPSRNTVQIIINAQDNASNVIQNVVGELQSIGEIALGLTTAALASASAAVIGFGAASLDAFGDFQVGVNEIFSILPGITEDAMRDMESSVQRFMEQTGRSAQEATGAIYEALSAGVPQDNIWEFMRVANMAAVGGVTDLQTAVDGLTSVVNAYGAEAYTAAEASDILFEAVRLGKLNMEDLSAFMYQVVPVAASMGVGLEDIAAALATMTSVGVPAQVATTQLRNAFVELNDPATQAGEIFQQLTGQVFQDFIAEGHTVAEALAIMETEADRLGIPISQLFNSIEAGQAALALTGTNMEFFAEATETMGNAAGATERAYNQMNQGIGMALNRLGARWESLLISMGRLIEPFVTPVVDTFSMLIALLSDALTNGPMSALATWAQSIPMWLHPVALILANLAGWVSSAAEAFGQFVAAINAGVPFLTAFQTFLYNVAGFDVAYYFGQFAAAAQEFFTQVMNVLGPVIDWVLANVELQDVLIALGIAIASVVIPAVIAFFAAFAPLVGLIGLVALLRTAWEENWGGIQQKSEAALITIGQLGVLIPYWLNQGAIAAEQFGILVSYWLNQASVTAQQLWFLMLFVFGEITTAVSDFVWAAINKFNELVTWLGDVWDIAWQGIVVFFNGLWDAIVAGLQAFQDGVWGVFNWIRDNVITPAQTAWQGIVTFFVGLWDAVSTGIQAFQDGIAAAFSWIQTNVIDPLMLAIQGVVDAFTNAQNAVSSFTGIGTNVTPYDAGTGAFNSAGGGFGAGVQPVNSGRQFGGSVSGGLAYTVGEQGPETFVPETNGEILNNRDTQLLGSGKPQIVIYMNIAGSVSDRDAKESAYKLKRELLAQGFEVN